MEFSKRNVALVLMSLLSIMLLSSANPMPKPETHYHDFVVERTPVKRLCKSHNIITVNGMFPGPTLHVRNGDYLVINVQNRVKENVTLHWHGVRQMRTAWADGPEFITQCPIRAGQSYTYRFRIEGQEGTLWWHAHASWVRATVYGALVIQPRLGFNYPFPKPAREYPVIIGEWWNRDPLSVRRLALRTGAAANISDAFTINAQPGDFYNCSKKETSVFPVNTGETVLLRVISASMNTQHFFSVAGHKMTVVGIDASYTKPFPTSVLMIGPGQTVDVLITTNQPPSRYYMAARAYNSAQNNSFDNTTTTAILQYNKPCTSKPPLLPNLPFYNDTNAVTAFDAGLRSLYPIDVPIHTDVDLFFTLGLGLFNCSRPSPRCGGPNGTRFTASMNNVSFALPSTLSILQAHLNKVPGVFTSNFPPRPPVQFDYTAQNVPRNLWQPVRGTEVLTLKYGSKVQLVLQDTSIVTPENHPMHLHGYEFYIVATGFGNFDPRRDSGKFNLVDPPRRNTVAVPVGGWAVVRFVAENPGAWLMHCHLDIHLTWGLAMVFIVENGVGELQTLEPPPKDLPLC